MNNALFAIPGLMPPKAPKFKTVYKSPEDGSLKMLIHCGADTDVVFYSIHIPGWREGIIKDPGYFVGHPDKKYKEYPEFMFISKTLPKNTLIPKKVIRDWPIPITEVGCIADEDKQYWILILPKRTLPPGATEIQVNVNGSVSNYVVSRPYFDIHSLNDITTRYKKFNRQEGEVLDVLLTPGEEMDIKIAMSPIVKDKELKATLIDRHGESILPVQTGSEYITITFPAKDEGYKAMWKLEAEICGTFERICAGDVIVVK